MSRRLLLLLALASPSLADVPFDWGFSEGAAPVQVGREASAARCIGCHEDQAAAWEHSRHRQAHTNALYQSGLVDEPSAFCVNCHAPLPEQAAEVTANLAAYAALDPIHGVDAAPPGPEPLAAEGVNCVVCHVRDGTILTSDGSSAAWAPHSVTVSSALTDGSLCAGCHEFRMPVFTGADWTLTDETMQGTVSEWRAWGGEQTCTDCHMPGGDHRFRGAYDLDFLRGALQVTWDGDALLLRSVGVGHHLPTGDLFRHLTVEADLGAGFEALHRIGRTFELVQDPHTLSWTKRETSDTRLAPDEIRRVPLPETTRSWRVRFHYGSPHDEERSRLPEEALIVVLAEGVADPASALRAMWRKRQGPGLTPPTSPATKPCRAPGSGSTRSRR